MGLRLRLLLLVGSVVLAALVAVALYSGEVANRAFIEVSAESEFRGPLPELEGLRERAAARLDRSNPAAWATALTALAEPIRDTHWLLAFDGDRRYVAASDPALDEATITVGDGDQLTIETGTTDDRGVEHVETLVVAVPLLPLSAGIGRPHGYLAAVPRPGPAEARSTEQRRIFRSSLSRYLVLGVAVVGLLALLATWVVGARVLGPIEALTRGARRMTHGDFSARVAVARSDELGELGRAFNEMAEGLGAVERWRQNMLDDTAHELRTPLTNLRCRIEAMEDGLAPLDRDQLTALGTEVQRLGRLVDDLRDLSLAEAGRLELHREPVRLAEVARSVAEVVAGADPAVEITRTGDDRVEADALRVRQILGNLVANAVSHGGTEGGIRVRIVGDETDVWVHVEDNGPGLDADEIPRLFERFYRAGDRRGGTGLGLAIVRQLTLAHGGAVEATNRRAGGARFSVRLPRRS